MKQKLATPPMLTPVYYAPIPVSPAITPCLVITFPPTINSIFQSLTELS